MGLSKFISIVGALLLTITFLVSPSFSEDPRYYPNVLVLPHVEVNGDFFTGISLLNTGDATSEILIVAYSENNKVLGESVLELMPGASLLNSLSDIFGHDLASRTGWVQVRFTGKLSGFALIGSDAQLARMPLQSEGRNSLVLPYVNSGEGLFTNLYLLNVGVNPSSLTLTAYDSAGELLESVLLEQAVASGHKVTGTVVSFFGEEISGRTSWLRIDADSKIMGFSLTGTTDRLFTVPME